MNRHAVKAKRHSKRKGYVVKGITTRHWWGRIDQDGNSSRAQLKRDTMREITEALS